MPTKLCTSLTCIINNPLWLKNLFDQLYLKAQLRLINIFNVEFMYTL